jgi:hypothetical protein
VGPSSPFDPGLRLGEQEGWGLFRGSNFPTMTMKQNRMARYRGDYRSRDSYRAKDQISKLQYKDPRADETGGLATAMNRGRGAG